MKTNDDSRMLSLMVGASVVLAVMALILMGALAFSRQSVLHLVLPFRALYTSDHAITEKGLNFLVRALQVSSWMLGASALMLFAYARVGKYLAGKLPESIVVKEEKSSPPSWSEKRYFLLILAAGLVLRTLQINRGLCYDELFTAHNFVNTASFWKTISSYCVFNNHIAYSVSARFAQLWLGQSEWVLRLPALMFGLGAIVAVWKFGREILGVKGGLLAALIFTLFPLHVVYSELARGYTGMALFVFLSGVFYLRLLEGARKGDVVGYVLASTLAVYFHLYSLLVIGVQGLMVLALVAGQLRAPKSPTISRQSFRALWISFFITAVLCVLCYLPVAVSLATYIQARGRGPFNPFFPWQVLSDLSGNAGVLLTSGLAVAATIGLYSLIGTQRRLAAYGVCIFILPVMVVMGVRPSDLYTRFFIYWLPWYALLLTQGIMVLDSRCTAWGRKMAVAFRLALAAMALAASYVWLAPISWNYETGPFGGYIAPYRAVGQAMVSQAGSNVCLCAFGEGCEELSYYAGRKLNVLHNLDDLQTCMRSNAKVCCAYNVTVWDTPEQKAMADFLRANGKVQSFAESRPCQEVVLFRMTIDHRPLSVGCGQ